MVDRTSLQTIIYDAILIALTRRGFLYLALPITPCALTFPSLETSCNPLRRRECLPPANGRIWPSSPLYSAVYRRSRPHPSENAYHLTHNGVKNILNKFQLGFK